MTVSSAPPTAAESSTQVYGFAGFELEPALARLSQGGAAVALEPRAYDVLLHLLRHRDRLVTNQELLQSYWPPHVTRTVLPHCIADLRRVLGDSASSQALIETTRGRGYRFVGAVQLRSRVASVAPASLQSKALTDALGAAARATAAAAHEEAASQFQACLELLEAHSPPDVERQCEVLLRLGRTQLWLGDELPARANYLRVADWARSAQRPRELAQAALGFTGSYFNHSVLDPIGRALVLEALDALGESGSARLRSALLTRLSALPPECESTTERLELARRAVALARTTGKPGVLMDALRGLLLAELGPDGRLDRRVAIADELYACAQAQDDRLYECVVHYHRATRHLVLGELAAAREACEQQGRAARELGMPPALWLFDHMRVSLEVSEGRFAESAQRLAAALPGARRQQRPTTNLVPRAQAAWLELLMGRGKSLVAAFSGLPITASAGFGRRACDALLLALHGPELPAREAALALHDWTSLPRDEHWLWNLQLVGTAMGYLREARGAGALYAALEPFGERFGLNEIVLVHFGPLHGTLALLAAAEGHFARALVHCGRSRALTELAGARPFAVLGLLDEASVLRGRAAPGDEARALTLEAEAIARGAELGMQRLVERRVTLAARGCC